jgi:hypothetical protein
LHVQRARALISQQLEVISLSVVVNVYVAGVLRFVDNAAYKPDTKASNSVRYVYGDFTFIVWRETDEFVILFSLGAKFYPERRTDLPAIDVVDVIQNNIKGGCARRKLQIKRQTEDGLADASDL